MEQHNNASRLNHVQCGLLYNSCKNDVESVKMTVFCKNNRSINFITAVIMHTVVKKSMGDQRVQR